MSELDRLYAFRIGALTGAAVGIVLLVLFEAFSFWVVIAGAAAGGAIGYRQGH